MPALNDNGEVNGSEVPIYMVHVSSHQSQIMDNLASNKPLLFNKIYYENVKFSFTLSDGPVAAKYLRFILRWRSVLVVVVVVVVVATVVQ